MPESQLSLFSLASTHHAMKTIIPMSLLAVLCIMAHAQDPVKTSPQYYKVLLENDQVRVLEYRLKAGERSQCIRTPRAWYMSSVVPN
jgi:hypothetical protein